MRFKKNFTIKPNKFDEISAKLDRNTFLDNLVLHADKDVDWVIGESLGTYERVANILSHRDAYKIQTDIIPFGKVMSMSEHERNVFNKRLILGLNKIVQIAEISYK